MEVLHQFTCKQASSALVLSLEDEVPDTVLEIDDEDIAKENGVDAIIERLNRLFNKDSTITKYQALEAFETFRRLASKHF